MAFGAGALLAALTLDLVASALAQGHFPWLAVGCMLGGGMFVGLNNVINHHGGFLRKSSTVVNYLRRRRRKRFRQALGELERISLFRGLKREDLEDLASAAVQADYEGGATVFSVGDPSDFLYVVAEGEVSTTDPALPDGAVSTHRPGGTPGQYAFITGSPHTRHAVATRDSQIWMLPREEFQRALGVSAPLSAATRRLVSDEIVTDYLRERQGLTGEQVAQWREGALEGVTSGVLPNAVTIERQRDEFVRTSTGIRSLPIFRGLSPEDLNATADRMFCVRYERGETIYRHGELADRLYIVEDGQVALIPPAGRALRRLTAERGEALGGRSFITNARRFYSAIAIAATELWVLRKSDFDALLRHNPAIHEKVRDYLEGVENRDYLTGVQGFAAREVQRWISRATRSVDSGRLMPSVADMAAHANLHKGAPLAIWLGILLDGIPESVVIGSSLIHAPVSFSLIAGLFLSNYPEALSSSVGMRQQGMSFARVLFMWASLMLLTGIGAALGSIFFVGADPHAFGLVQGIAAGAMLTMIAQTMVPDAYLKAGPVIGISTLMGFLAAIFFNTLE
jgi:CRP-like cAMP-binding protein